MVPDNKYINGFNPVPFNNIDEAVSAIQHKHIAPGEIVIAYYKDMDEPNNIGSFISTGSLHKHHCHDTYGTNQIYRNQLYVDRCIDALKLADNDINAEIESIKDTNTQILGDIISIKGNIEDIHNIIDSINDNINNITSDI